MTPIDTEELERHADTERNRIINRCSTDLESIVNGHDPEIHNLNVRVWDRLDRMAVEIEHHRAHRKAEAWQPISSAPLGQSVLVFRPAMWGGKGHIGVAKWNTDEYAKCPKPFWESCEGWIRQIEDRA
ncbi:hypothetical protein LO749_12005 [Paracoccus denitrificans]|uniref:hypothetical protein n=1 Tax=Paracoccus denitrificans TaxID=266 RepID=UPI001E4BFF9F|nr:hypothetical protein [Paracoccus denitrificans]UFS64857.1 hypothetical protein LO749_12005 [Paracoccus denitrificans]